MFVLLFFTFVVAYFIYLYWERWQHFQLREKLGLKGPKASMLFGNMDYFIKRTKELGYDDGYEEMARWTHEYGDTFGIYMGRYLEIVTTNEDFVREVYIKQFSKFGNRCLPKIFEENGLNDSLVQMSRENGWKEVRACMAAQFSTGKMRMMYETVKDKIDLFITILDEKKGKTFDIYDDWQALTMDVIGKCAFAIESNCQRDRNEMFYIQAKEVFRNIDLKENWLVPLSVFLPEFSWFWRLFYSRSGIAAAEAPLLEGLAKVYDSRQNGEMKDSVDILQLLLNKSDTNGKSMSRRQVIENCFAFLLAGYETTSTALGYCTYLLAKNPEKQQILYEEIKKTKEEKGLTFESIHSMKYLDAVFKESLRILPPVLKFSGNCLTKYKNGKKTGISDSLIPDNLNCYTYYVTHIFTARECLESTVINGIEIPKGTWVFVPPYTVHTLERNWENPLEFEPERFLNDSEDPAGLKWIPFGVGPRNCVGMRFAEMEFKMAVAKFIEKFSVEIPEGTPELKRTVMGIIMQPVNGIKVKTEERK